MRTPVQAEPKPMPGFCVDSVNANISVNCIESLLEGHSEVDGYVILHHNLCCPGSHPHPVTLHPYQRAKASFINLLFVSRRYPPGGNARTHLGTA